MSDQIIDATPKVHIAPVGRKDWGVSLDGRMIAQCTRKDDAQIIEQAFQLAAQASILLDHVTMLQDALELKYSTVVERLRKRFMLKAGRETE
jgi:hypothetical protein